jgi:hypothetical protein
MITCFIGRAVVIRGMVETMVNRVDAFAASPLVLFLNKAAVATIITTTIASIANPINLDGLLSIIKI